MNCVTQELHLLKATVHFFYIIKKGHSKLKIFSKEMLRINKKTIEYLYIGL